MQTKRILSLFLLFALLLSAGACGGRGETAPSAGFTLVEGTTAYRAEKAEGTPPQADYPIERDDVQLSGNLLELAQGRDGTMYALASDKNGPHFLSLDESGKEKERLSLPVELDEIFDGGGNYDLLATSGSTVYALDFSSKTITSLFDMLAVGLPSVMALVPEGEGFYVYPDPDSCYLLLPDTGEPVEKTVLTFATLMSTAEMEGLIAEFNATHADYAIELVEYGRDGKDRLLTELAAGDMPDMINLSNDGLPVNNLIEKGYLVDLYPYLDADPELSRESLLPSVRKAFERNGKLYEAFSGFFIQAFVTCVDDLPDDLDEIISEQLAILDAGGTPKQLVAQRGGHGGIPGILKFANLDSYIDWETGTCSFESESFINLLRYAAAVPDSGKALLLPVNITNANDITSLRATYGEDLQIEGFPCLDGVKRNYAMRYTDVWAICTGSEHKDICWEFIRQLWLPDYQLKPASSFVLAMTMPSNEEAFYGKFDMDRALPKGSRPSEEDIEFFAELVNSVEWANGYGVDRRIDTILGIMNEECAALYAGDRTPEETAHLIQQRVSLFVAEQS